MLTSIYAIKIHPAASSYLETRPLPDVYIINISLQVYLESTNICTVHVVPETHAQVLWGLSQGKC